MMGSVSQVVVATEQFSFMMLILGMYFKALHLLKAEFAH
jgi:hypothetical protein